MVESSDDAILSKDLDGIIQTWNQGAERIFGYTAEEAVARPITLIIPEDRLHEKAIVLRRIRAGLPVEHFETVRRHKSGRLVDISLTVSPIRNADGVILGASKIARDISEQKRLRQMADEGSRSKDEFLALLSHELRTPLNAVVGYARMLRQKDLPMDVEQRAKALEVLERNADALGKLVNDVLDTSQVVTGKLRLAVEPLSLDDVLREAVDTIQPAARAKHVTVETELAPGLDIAGDRDRLRQVAWNLLANAVKFTPVGGRVSLRAMREGAEIVVRVRDTGSGIAADDIPLIFQRFWQAGPGMSRERGGLGLGLALVRHFVELHGGTVSATSAGIGQGAEFIVRLPVEPRAADPALERSSVEELTRTTDDIS
ncbi:MAG: PAS domain-containing sensor histidine kinase [Acidobacteria bacterium]|nr:PAS domain-containing sensor histidine kinase [Acidobacteriota bacterium]MCA1649010.1 PAS domain-containing sensor histidine kinase [Acidobacteriota bacterium]